MERLCYREDSYATMNPSAPMGERPPLISAWTICVYVVDNELNQCRSAMRGHCLGSSRGIGGPKLKPRCSDVPCEDALQSKALCIDGLELLLVVLRPSMCSQRPSHSKP